MKPWPTAATASRADFSASRGDRLDLRKVFGDRGMDTSGLTDGGFVRLSQSGSDLRLLVDRDDGGDLHAVLAMLDDTSLSSVLDTSMLG